MSEPWKNNSSEDRRRREDLYSDNTPAFDFVFGRVASGITPAVSQESGKFLNPTTFQISVRDFQFGTSKWPSLVQPQTEVLIDIPNFDPTLSYTLSVDPDKRPLVIVKYIQGVPMVIYIGC